MLEGVQLKKHLEGARQELSQALYQHDAACRVIARLVRERDEARAALSGAASYTAAALSAGGEGRYWDFVHSASRCHLRPVFRAGETARPGISDDVIGAMVAQSKTLNKSRKKRKTPEDLTTVDAIKAWRVGADVSPVSLSCFILIPRFYAVAVVARPSLVHSSGHHVLGLPNTNRLGMRCPARLTLISELLHNFCCISDCNWWIG